MVTWNNSQQSSLPPGNNDTASSSTPLTTPEPGESNSTSAPGPQIPIEDPSFFEQPFDQNAITLPLTDVRFSSGTWQPRLTSLGGQVLIKVKSSHYTRVGNLVTAFFDFTVVDFVQIPPTDALEISNLPFAPQSSSAIVGGGIVYYFTHVRTNITLITGTLQGNESLVKLWRSIGQSRLNRLTVSDLQNISNLAGQIQYTAESTL